LAKVVFRGDFAWVACPACGVSHRVDKRWTVSGDAERPTFDPRIKTLTLRGSGNIYCFARVQNGYIEFDPTCTHDLAGHTLRLPDWDDPKWVAQKEKLEAKEEKAPG
jgi:hypothetical protein